MPLLSFSFASSQKFHWFLYERGGELCLAVPFMRGTSIGLDNTCATTTEIRKFFYHAKTPGSALYGLINYQQELEYTIHVATDAAIINKARQYLKKVKDYIQWIRQLLRDYEGAIINSEGVFPQPIQDLFKEYSDKTSVFVMQLQTASLH